MDKREKSINIMVSLDKDTLELIDSERSRHTLSRSAYIKLVIRGVIKI